MEEILLPVRIRTFVPIFYFALLCTPRLPAQSPIIPPPLTQSFTPAALAPGTPAGSYILSDFDTVNYGNMSVNFRFPLVKIGGRGSVSAVMMPDFNIYSQWAVIPTPVPHCSGGGNGGSCSYTWQYQINNNTAWSSAIPARYGVPRMMLREGGWPCGSGYPAGTNIAGYTLSRVTFIGADGTEMALLDLKSGGEPQAYSPGAAFYDRGSTWVTRDGSSAIFTTASGQDIVDNVATAQNCSVPPTGISGTMTLHDGTVYTFLNGYATSVADRNGNTISYQYNTAGVLTGIKDQLGRTYGVTLSQIDGATGRTYDELTYPGFNGATRPIKIFYDTLNNVLRTDQSPETTAVLWPNVGSTASPPGGTFISEILLPDQSTYTFQRDSYGNVARVQLPSGGAVEYDWAGQVESTNTSSTGPTSFFLRCVLTQRREYLDLAAKSPSRITKYGTAPIIANLPPGVSVADYDGTGSVLQALVDHYVVPGAWPPSAPATAYEDPTTGQEPTTIYFDTDGQAHLREIDRTYMMRSCTGDPTCWWQTTTPTDFRPPHDDLIQLEKTTESGMVKQTQILYDGYNNQRDVQTFDWGSPNPGSLLREVSTIYKTDSAYINANILNLPTDIQVLNGSKAAEVKYNYDETTPTSYTIAQNTTPAGPRGNRTSILECLDLSSACANPPTTTYTYDVAGNVLSITDANSHTTTLSYVDKYSDAAVPNTYGHVTKVTYPQLSSSVPAQTVSWQYDYNTGKPANAADVNSVNTAYSFNDPLDRLTQIARASGIAGVETRTNITYTPYIPATPSQPTPIPEMVDVTNDQNTTGDGAIHTRTYYDGFGRDYENDQFVSPSQYVSTTKTYDPLGRVSASLTPTFSTNTGTTPVAGTIYNPPFETDYVYDGLGRTTKTTTLADNAFTTSSYAGNKTTFTDQNGVARATFTDGLGRLVQVIEDPTGSAFLTAYGYDPMGDLVCVNQGTAGSAATNPGTYSCKPSLAHSRSFSYDALQRLTSATNPESGTITYTYDRVGNVISKTDARGRQTCFGTLSGSACTSGYDALNRLTAKTYSDGTPPVTYAYDAPPPTSTATQYFLGRLASVSTSGSNASNVYYTAYDPLGRITGSAQNWQSSNFAFSYTYNLAGSLLTEKYPSGRVVSTTYDAANRPAYLQGTATNPTTKTTTVTPYIGNPASSPATPIQYWPHGAIYAYLRGNNLEHAESYNGRLQLTESYESTGNGNTPANLLFVSCPNWGLNPSNLNLYDLCPHSAASNNNGNLQSYAEYLGNPQAAQFLTFSQSFAYDHLNRLTNATDTYWSRVFSYDQWGNMAVTTPAATATPLLNVNTPTSTNQYNANNQISASSYDSSGNLTSLQPNLTFTYDAESRQITAGSSTYSYDGNGHRVLRVTGGVTTYYLYDAMGLLTAEYSNVINTSPCATCYLSYDHLGSVRLVTDGNGNIISRHDFLPFGEEVPALASTGRIGPGWGVADDVNQRFTGKERDIESGLDFFGARYYGSALGRFTSPDEVFADQHPADPQSWNLYGYVRNNPLKNVDPTGKGTFNAALLNNPEVRKAVANLSAGVAAYAKQSLNENKQGLNRISDLVKTVSGGRIDLGHVTITPLTPAEEKAAPTGAAVVGAVTAITGGVKGEGEGGTTSLFRAVGSAEAGDIGNTGAFGGSPTGSEFKGFFYSESDAQSFGARMTQMTGDPHTVVSADAPTDLVNASPAHNAATEGQGVLIKNENLPQVKIKQPNQ